jgi:CubicO group peptidase (beta-lactamase class C family)
VDVRNTATGRTRKFHWALLLLLPLAGCDGRDAAGHVDSGRVAEAVAEPRVVRTVGLDSALMADAVTHAAQLPRLRTLTVARHGEIEIERHFRGPGLSSPANVKSVSKSVLSALVGIAISDGHLAGPDQGIVSFFPRQLNGDDARKQQITVGHLLSMQSGLEGTSGANYGRWVTSSNWVNHALARPLLGDPGTVRNYSTGNSHLLSAVLTQATGRSTWAYARERLARPLGITLPHWPTDPQGIYFGGNEMRMTPRAMLQFGEMYRNGGRHNGEQVVPEQWVRQSLTPRAGARRTGEGYGYGWFISQVGGHPMFYAWGYGGQFIFVVPDLELTVVTTSDPDAPRERDHLAAVRSLLSDLIVPAAERGERTADGS